MITPADLDLEHADRAELVERLVASGAYSVEAAEAIADLIEDGELL